MRRQDTNLAVDAVLFGLPLVSMLKDWTGMALHQWLGVVMGAVAFWHLGAHWPWIRAMLSRLPHAATGRPRVFFILDGSLFASLGVTLLSGLAISTWVGLSTAAGPWTSVHIIASLLTLLLTSIKVCLHWCWVVAAGRRWIASPAHQAPAPTPAPTGSAQHRADRRQFLRLTAIIGTACLLAGVPAWNEVRAQDAPLGSEEPSSASAPGGGAPSRTDSGMACGRGCSNPGQCHRYSDADGDGWCDLGQGSSG